MRRILIIFLVIINVEVVAQEVCSSESALSILDSMYTWLHGIYGKNVSVPGVDIFQQEKHRVVGSNGTIFGYYEIQTGRIKVFCDKNDYPAFVRAVRHEGAHHYFRAAYGVLPLWLEEGVATYMEAASFENGGAKYNINRLRLNEFIENLKWNRVPRLIDLLRSEHFLKNSSIHYAAYWALIFVFMHHDDPLIQDGRRSFLLSLLEIGRNSPFVITEKFLDYVHIENPDGNAWELRWHRDIWDMQ